MEMSRSAHTMLAILGGKAPHNHGVFIGGITTQATPEKIVHMRSILESINKFIKEIMIPDTYTIAEYYKDYFKNGGGYGNLLSFGCFDRYEELGTLYLEPLEYSDGRTSP
jgi:hydrogenase large subunit